MAPRETQQGRRFRLGEFDLFFTVAVVTKAVVTRAMVPALRLSPRLRAEPGRGGDAFEILPPEGLGARQVLPAQPGDIITVRPARRDLVMAPASELIVTGEDLLDDDVFRPAVQNQVMVTPDELMAIVRK